MSLESTITAMAAKAAEASPLGSTLKFNFGDDGQIFIDGTGDTNVVSADDKDADCLVNVTYDDFKALVSGDLNPMTAFMSGKIKVKGDMGVAMKLQSLI